MPSDSNEETYQRQLAEFLATIESQQRAQTLLNLTLGEAAARAIYVLNGEGESLAGDPLVANITLEGPLKPKRQTLDDIASEAIGAIDYMISNREDIG